MMLHRLLALRGEMRGRAPLVHCLVHHIASNDCANIILAAGGRPFMAEHPEEAPLVTQSADALLVNLGNISDLKMQAMLLSGKMAGKCGIPSVLDLVGVAASRLRLDFATTFIAKCRPGVIKGNISEFIALREGVSAGQGIDAAAADKEMPCRERLALGQSIARKYRAVTLISGAQDVLSTPEKQYLVTNGHPLLTAVTGTGCMQGALIAAFSGIRRGNCLEAALLAALVLGVSAEAAARDAAGPGMFRYKLFDCVYNLSDELLVKLSKAEEVSL